MLKINLQAALLGPILLALVLFAAPETSWARSYCSSQNNWLTLGGNNSRDGWARDEQKMQPPLRLDWVALQGEPELADANMIIESSPVIYNGSVFITTFFDLDIESTILIPAAQGGPVTVTDASSSLISLRLSDGFYQWHTQLGFSGVEAIPTVDPARDRIYVGARDGKFYALDADNGNIVWSRFISSSAAAAVVDDRIFVGSSGGNGQLYILDAANNGEILDQKSLVGDIRSSPVATDDNELFVVVSNGASSVLHRYDVSNDTLDQLTHQQTLLGDSWASPLIRDDYIIHRSGSWHLGEPTGYVYVFNRDDLSSVIAPYETIGSSRSSPAMDNQRLYISSNNPFRLLALDINGLLSGANDLVEWVFEPPDGGALSASPLVANGDVYIGTDDNGDPEGVFYALSARTGEIAWQYQATDGTGSAQSSPAIGGGKIVFVSYDEQSRVEHGVHAFSAVRPQPTHCMFDPANITLSFPSSETAIQLPRSGIRRP
ncbi:MAG: PQQ-binding-like beta-propeller repeat protein [Gammaproteobacteria bacterium]|nr:PQQ-binding-like beta-propeller repeat protein [Gammaproteobacteria bacterium]